MQAGVGPNDDFLPESPEEHAEGREEGTSTKDDRGFLKRCKSKVKEIFHTFPNNKKNIKEYYLRKMISMYSSNFRTALALLVVIKVATELTIIITSKSNNGMMSTAGRLVMVAIFGLMLNPVFLDRYPHHSKKLILFTIYFDLVFDVLQIYLSMPTATAAG